MAAPIENVSPQSNKNCLTKSNRNNENLDHSCDHKNCRKVDTVNETLDVKGNSFSHSIEEFLVLKKKARLQAGPKQTFKPPQSSVLSQVKHFLPVMADANKKLDDLLQEVPASDVDIEHIDNTEGPVIEMDIALGLMDDDSSSDDDISDTDSGSSDTDGNFTEKTESNIKLTKAKDKPPFIEEINDSTDDCCIQARSDHQSSNCDNGVAENTAKDSKEPHR